MTAPILCDTCGQPCHGGIRRYVDATGHDRIGCTDDRACLAKYTTLNRLERRDIERGLRYANWIRRTFEADISTPPPGEET